MHYKILLALAIGLSFIFQSSPIHAQGGTLAPCLPDNAATMIWQADGEQPVRLFNADELALVEGTQGQIQ